MKIIDDVDSENRNLHDVSHWQEPYAMKIVDEKLLTGRVSFERRSTLGTSQKGCLSSLDSETVNVLVESGNQSVTFASPETEGKANCEDSQNGLPTVETKEKGTAIQDSETIFEEEGCCIDTLVGSDVSDCSTSHYFRFLSDESSSDIDPVHLNSVTKSTDRMSNCELKRQKYSGVNVKESQIKNEIAMHQTPLHCELSRPPEKSRN